MPDRAEPSDPPERAGAEPIDQSERAGVEPIDQPERAGVEPIDQPERAGVESIDLPERAERSRPRTSESGRLRQSMAELEHAFSREISLERRRRDSLRRTAEQRTLKREVQRRHKRGSMRFALLVLTLVATAAIVTVVMFRTLYLLLS